MNFLFLPLLLDIVLVLLEQLSNALILEVGTRHAFLQVAKFVEDLLCHTILMIVFNQLKVKLAADKFDMCLKLLFKDLIFQFRPQHHGVHFFQAEFCVSRRGEQLRPFVILLRFFRGNIDL